MPADRFPAEFEDILSRQGRRVLAGTHPLCGALADPRRRFESAADLIDARQARRLRALLDRHLLAALERIDRPIPPETIWEMTDDYAEMLPKAARASTVYFDSPQEPGVRIARRIGLAAMLRSESFRAFAAALAGRKLAEGWGRQVLCYGPGDYAGPHNDHHPRNRRARAGYVDVHVSLAAPSVAHQWLVYARAGHFTEMVSVAAPATVSAYRLPFWHYVTPLAARPGRAGAARRWVLLGTFLYAAPRAP
ncbi:M20 family metallopeptidase [Vineibacter terrae]|uniref:M20 family metallopeptidase n=1 Tax=Vineibacter terrae TaxID=2586908 RepID=A0A5C8PCL1_9HYPH|nr:M20 family metallopeptidase [Vineibacter terrae]TXL71548.1 M20 family metallopeptidase [Vineibacter terrae]